jgi:hypothetical protein
MHRQRGIDYQSALRVHFTDESGGIMMAQYNAVKLAARSAAKSMATFRDAMKIRLDDYDKPVAKRGQSQPKQQEATRQPKK